MTTHIDHRRALDAYYVDFEGFRGAAPALVGTLCGETFETVLLDPRLAPVARRLGLPLYALDEWLARLLSRAERVDAAIVAFSPHEEEVVREHAPALAERFAARAVNAQPFIRAALRRHGHALPRGTRGLKAFAAIRGTDYPEALVAESVPRRLRSILHACQRNEDWEDAPAAAQSRLSLLLEYNRLDCHALRSLALAVAREGRSALPEHPAGLLDDHLPTTLK